MRNNIPHNISCIIVGPDHYNTLNVLRSISQHGLEAYIILISSKIKNIVARSKYAKYGHVISSYSDILSVLMEIGSKIMTKIPVIATNDRAISTIDTCYNTLSNFLYLPNCNYETNGILREMDKGRQVLLAQKHGFKVPLSFSFELSEKITLPSEIMYPCIVKPLQSIGGSKSDMRICYNLEELQNHLNSIRNNIKKCQIQQFINNEKFFLVGGVRLPNNETIIPGIVEKLKFGHKNQTLGLNAFGKLDRINRIIQNKCIAYLNDINYHGPFSFELVYSKQNCDNEEDLFFIELNLRTDGLFYFYDAANLSLVTFWVNFHYNKELNCNIEINNPIFGMSETLYILEYFTLKHILSTIKDLYRSQAFCYYNKRDIRPFFAKFLNLY